LLAENLFYFFAFVVESDEGNQNADYTEPLSRNDNVFCVFVCSTGRLGAWMIFPFTSPASGATSERRNEASSYSSLSGFFSVLRAPVLFSQQQLCPQPPASRFSLARRLVFLKSPAPLAGLSADSQLAVAQLSLQLQFECFLNPPLF